MRQTILAAIVGALLALVLVAAFAAPSRAGPITTPGIEHPHAVPGPAPTPR